MSEKKQISKSIFRAMKLFGGVQVVSNLCSIVLNKLVAMWIGPVGIGLFSIFNSSADMLKSITSLGLRTSAVRDMAMAVESRDEYRIGRVIAVIRRWAWIISLLGAAVTIALSPLLSRWSFGDSRHTWHFILLSLVLFFNGFTNSELSILQGCERLKQLARASLYGAVGGLACSIPLFYFLREDSILLSVIAYHAALLAAVVFLRNRDNKPTPVSLREAYNEGRGFLRLGIYMTIGEFMALLYSYALSAYLNRTAGTETVGFYQAANSLAWRYVALILSALSMEYFPRLARVNTSRMRMQAFVSKEVQMLMLMLLPAIAVFLLCREWIIRLLYTEEFLTILPLISWMLVGMVCKAFSWSLAYTIVAKGDGRIYILTETASAAIGLALNIGGFLLFGLTGIGYAVIAWYVVYSLLAYVIYAVRYGCRLSWSAALYPPAAVLLLSGLIVLLDNGMQAAAVTLTTAILLLCLWQFRHQIK